MGFHDRPYYGNQQSGGFPGGVGGMGRNPFSAGGTQPSGLAGMSKWSVNTWIIVANVVVFVIGIILSPAGHSNPILFEIGAFSTQKALNEFQIWRFVTFQFLHAGIWHILFNMLGMYWFGPQVEQHLGSRRYLAFYLLSGIAGAGLFLILNVAGQQWGAMPFLLPGSTSAQLVGASAGVFGVLLAMAYLRPNQVITLLVMLVIPVSMRIRTLAYGMVILALVTVYQTGNNAGGEAGHLGGAILGAILIRYPSLLNWACLIPLDRFKKSGHHAFGRFGNSGFPSDSRKTVKNKSSGAERSGFFDTRQKNRDDVLDREVDRILSKVASQGIGSLTKKERDIMQKATEREHKK